MADETTSSPAGAGGDDRWPDDEASGRIGGGSPGQPGYGGYGRDFGGGGRDQGFEGSHGAGYGAGFATGDYRQGLFGLDEVQHFGPGEAGIANDHDGWSPGRDAQDALAAPRRRGRFDCESPDGVLRDRVVSRLMADRLLDASRIEVMVEDAIVILMGSVRRPSDIALAELLAREAVAGCGQVLVQLGLEPAGLRRR